MYSIDEECRAMVLALSGVLLMSACPLLHGLPSETSQGLVITVLDGEGALNDIRQRTAHEPIIQVEDENHRPVVGAVVLFTLPGSGPSGFFAGGAQVLSTVTDDAGKAVAQGLQPNTIAGSYEIHVKVNFNGSSAEKVIHQKNVSPQTSSATQHAAHALSTKSILLIVGAAAAAGTVAAVIATSSGGSSTVISAGPPTVGPPTSATASFRLSLHGRNH